MEQASCCVCGKVLGDQPKEIGARLFCDLHYQHAIDASRSRWRRLGLIEVGLIALFVATVGALMGSQTLPNTLSIGLPMALIPATIWMVYIYRLDRIEPEPWPVVLSMFALGALLGQGLVTPLVNWFTRHIQGDMSIWSSLLISIAVIGTIQQFATYLAVRYSVYVTDEFDEPLDGLVYATAAGLGLATLANVQFVLESEGLRPLPAAVAIASHALVHVASAAILGFGMGRAKFSNNRRQLWLGISFLLSIIVNGGLKQLIVFVGIDGAAFHPWFSLIVALGAVALILGSIDFFSAKLSSQNFEPTSSAPGQAHGG